ncbi:MAG: NUDIX domain-containing protein [Candidatus Micrarchaeota archaeon]
MTEKNQSRVSAKAFIVQNRKVLVIKRSDYTSQCPGIWELPGGQIETSESIMEGLQRETLEETALEITVEEPLSVRRFQRVDGSWVDMTIFICTAEKKDGIKLSREHDAYLWLDIAKAKKTIAEFYYPEIDAYQKKFSDKK